MKIEIRNRWTAKVIFEMEADSIRIAVEAAVSQRISLSAADLRDANLRNANLSAADLRNANLSAANLRNADLRDANLSAADLRDANLSAADLRNANLSAANLRNADLSAADLRNANLSAVKNDLWSVLVRAIPEVPGLLAALREGRVDGSVYQGTCACLVGTIANIRGCDHESLPGLAPDPYRPAESWFMSINKGDTPESNSVAKITVEWIEEFQKCLEVKQ